MKFLLLVITVLTLAVSPAGAKPRKDDKPPKDVKVVNNPSVTVSNDTLDVKIVNTSPVPVSIENAIPVSIDYLSSSVVEYRVIGFTTEMVTGGSIDRVPVLDVIRGIPALHTHCMKKFGPNARAATTEDVLRPIASWVPERAGGWPVGRIISEEVLLIGDGKSFWPVSPEGHVMAASASDTPAAAYAAAQCNQFSSEEGGFSLEYSKAGSPSVASKQNCAEMLPVVCSGPFAVPGAPLP